MKKYLSILTITTVFVVVFAIGCQPEAEIQTPQPQSAPKAEVEPQKLPETPYEDKTQPAEIQTTETEIAKIEQEPASEVVPEPEAEKPKPAPVVPPEPDPNPVVVTINGTSITEDVLEERVKPQLERMRSQVPAQFIDQLKQQLKKQALEVLIVEQLLSEQISAENIEVSEQEVIDRLKEMGAHQETPLSLDEIKAMVESQGQSFERTKQRIKKGLEYQKLMMPRFANMVNITEQDARAYYMEHPNDFKIPETVTASHILISPDTTDPNVDPNQARAEAETQIKDLLSRVKAGADFAELARDYSSCPSASKGGSLGSFSRGQMVPPFEQAAFALEAGQISDVVETRFGYHIIKVHKHSPPAVMEFEQVKDDIIKTIEQQKRKDIIDEYVESLKAQANIVYPPESELNRTESQP